MKNPPTLLYEKFTPATPKKESYKNNKRSQSYKPLFKRHFGKKQVSRYGLFCVFWRFLYSQMAKLCPINFIIGLPPNLNVNGGQNKFIVDVSKNVAKITNIWPKNRPAATLTHDLLLGITRSYFI